MLQTILKKLVLGLILLTTLSTAFAQLPAEAEIKSQIDPELAAGMQATVVVKFNDPNLEKVVRGALKKPTGDITDVDMAKFTRLDGRNKNIHDLTGLEYAYNIKYLYLSNNQIRDISSLKNMTRLDALYISQNQIVDISVLKNMTKMTRLVLSNNLINDISALENMIEMVGLHLNQNQISDISALRNMHKLFTLLLENNQVRDISVLYKMTDMGGLNFNYNRIFDISVIKKMTELTTLNLSYNQLSNDDLDNIRMKNQLETLTLKGNPGITSGTAMRNLSYFLAKLKCEQIEWDGKCDVDPNKVAIVRFYPDSIEFGDTLTVETTATDSEGNLVQVKMNWGDGTITEYSQLMFNGSTFTFQHKYSKRDTFLIQALARDQFGNETKWSAAREIIVTGENPPPTATITSITPKPAETNQVVTLLAIAEDLEDQMVMLQADWGDGTISPFSELQASGSAFSFTHIYATAGSYEIKVLPKDEYGLAGEWSEAQSLEVKRANSAPVAAISDIRPNPAVTGELVSVKASAVDVENDAVRVKVDWGDGYISNYTSWEASGTDLYFNHYYPAPGNFKIRTQAQDNLNLEGKWSASQTIQVNVPNGAPTATISQVTPGSAETGQTITVQATAADPQNEMVQMRVDWGDGTITDYSVLQASGAMFDFTHAFAAEGNFRIRARSRDASGLESNWSNEFSVHIYAAGTTLVASITEIVPNPVSVNVPVIVRATAVDQEKRTVQLQIDWGNGTISNYTDLKASGAGFEFSNSFSDTGKFSVKVRAKNSTGAESNWSAAQILTVKIGNLAPVARVLSALPNPAETNQPVLVKLTATDPNGDPVRLKMDWGDGRITDYTELRPGGYVFEFTPAYSAPGTYLIRVLGKDEAGLEGEWSVNFPLIVQPPNLAPETAIQTVTPNPVETGSEVTVQISVSDANNDSVQLRMDWGDGKLTEFSSLNETTVPWQFTHTYPKAKIYFLRAQARDRHGKEGNWSNVVKLTVKKPNRAPEAYIKSLSPMSATTGTPIALTVAATDSNNDRVQVQVDWGDGTRTAYSALQAANTLVNFSYAYQTAGDFGLKVRGRDENGAEGEWSKSIIMAITERPAAPIARIDSLSANTLLLNQQLVVFATATDLNTNDAVQLQMDWGDGTFSKFSDFKSSGTQVTFSRTYGTPGEYSLKVLAQDASGLASEWSEPWLLQVIRPNTAPRDSIVYLSPQPAVPGVEVTVQARAWDAEKDQLQMKINWGDGSESPYSEMKVSGALFTFTHNYHKTGTYTIAITTKDASGLESTGAQRTLLVQTMLVENEKNQPLEYTLQQNYPNPFNSTTIIQFSLKEAGMVDLLIYDTTGREIRLLAAAPYERGQHTVVWDGLDHDGQSVSSGLYFYLLKSKGQVLTRKLVLLK